VVAMSEYDQVLLEDNTTVITSFQQKNHSFDFIEPPTRIPAAFQTSLQQQIFC
jgi:hypothetical protein